MAWRGATGSDSAMAALAFMLAEARRKQKQSLAVSGSAVHEGRREQIETMAWLGAGSSAELLVPETLHGLKALFSVSMYKKMWLPDRMHKDYLKVSQQEEEYWKEAKGRRGGGHDHKQWRPRYHRHADPGQRGGHLRPVPLRPHTLAPTIQ